MSYTMKNYFVVKSEQFSNSTVDASFLANVVDGNFSAMLMTVIFVVVYTKGLRGFSGIAIGGIVGLDIFLLAFISGASMNPARSLAPALVSGVSNNLWLYWSATFIGTSIVALMFRIMYISRKSCSPQDIL